MADSVIKLGNYDEDTLTDLKVIPAIADLENLSYKVFNVDSDEFTVHFHLKERACKACVDEYCWNAGIYFNMQAFNHGELLIVAHFQVIPAATTTAAGTAADDERAPLRSVLRGTSAPPSVQAVPRSEPFVTSFNETEELRVKTILSSVGSSLTIPPNGSRIARALPPPVVAIEAIDLTNSPPRPRRQQSSRQSSRATSDEAPRQSPRVQHLPPPIRQPSLQAPQEQNRYRSFEPPSRWRTYVPAQAPGQQHRFEWRQHPAPSSGAVQPLTQQDSPRSHKRRRVVDSLPGNPTPSHNTYGSPKASLSTSRNLHARPRTSENLRMLLLATPPQHAPVPSSRPSWTAINRPDAIEEEGREELPIVNNIWRYGLLPAHVKGAQWAPDFAAAQEKLKHIHEHKRSNHAHAEMIDGVYGIVASRPCVHCTTPCRIYHPALQPDVSRNLGFVCAGCRLKSRPGGCDAA